ncbi:programmed cell death 1 ligand 2 [Carcharodon carcharias]|uniref:programmed cell death 1 ligand 2 n=1 Tax=Carcharodon carcharias TaxID=13397 RepID=UPI001B7EA7AA|nr:programmed cell death 1 ligand 2 [Carcharodon carcharias]XP_041073123.1 programmed cell death 1 ligand 2 [Carcharodon carcharias]XP_041073124.1 programmed cell death 1 ligand 2 [Carcharodon carcharias]XP_041073125.1 programmed cell death 1 ligand 2 [Carcharodon carcharias]XP_041073126.1 programmed cell death 1 ligand 2 [Carcharodon carcharias]XP_041073127.1 programmed cell death 1 ligand 2 [Carcharodon carcharias]XP_041073128.1 programmed cell death 1 ligand 2 [Carcharodon carcharias]XP_0
MNCILEMGSYHTVTFLYVILYTRTTFAERFLTFNCVHSVTGIFDKDTELPCSFTTTNKQFSLYELSINKDGNRTDVFSKNKNISGAQGRIKLLHPNSTDVSLLIQKTKLSDGGTYQYDLLSNSGHQIQTITLKVKAPYCLPNVTAFPTTTPMGTTNLICETTGYPLAQIHWFIDGASNLTSEANTSSAKTLQGLLKITSMLQIKEVNISKGNYSCAVWNVEENVYEVQQYFQILDKHRNTHQQRAEERKKNILIAVFVIFPVCFIAFVILALLQCSRRRHPAVRI